MSLNSATDHSFRPATKRWSLATRLTVWYAASAFLLLVVASGLLYRTILETIDLEDEQDLAEQIGDLQMVLKERPLNLPALEHAVINESSPLSFSPIFLRVLNRNGRQLVESPGMSSVLPTNAFPNRFVVNLVKERPATLHSSTGRIFRGLTAVVENDYLVQAAVDEAGNVKLLQAYRQRLSLVLGVGLVVCALVGHTIASRGIRPVKDIAATMQGIRATTLNERIDSPHLPAELSTLANTFNEMLDRLEDAFSRLSRFSADLAHELRTPINNLRGGAEVALSKPRSSEEYRELLNSCLEECVRLSQLIDRLLFLARAENPQTKVQRQPIVVSVELKKLRDFYEVAAGEAGVTLILEAPDGVVAEVDGPLFQQAVGNLIENALTHTSRGGTITLRATQQDGALRIEVTDTGCGIAAEHLPHVFDRFYRVDSARSRQTGGLGLGLAIVKGITTLHGGTVQLQSQPGKGTTVTLSFPVSQSDA